MKYYLIAGERSGDQHGANLIRALIREDPDAEFRCLGGDAMQEAGATVAMHYRKIAIMGFVELLFSIFRIIGALRFCRRDIKEYRPSVLILIDFAGFNLRMARSAKKMGIRVYYYITPKVWAWNSSRVRLLERYTDHLFVILPFEEAFFAQFEIAAHFVGNPVQDAVAAFEPKGDLYELYGFSPDKPIIALLPGSRKQEIARLLPDMVQLAKRFPDFQFGLSVVRNVEYELYRIAQGVPNIIPVPEDTFNLLLHSDAAIVVSGTATLETALFEVPQVVVYKASWLSYQVARRLIRVKYISLVNLIAEEEVVVEMIQQDLNTDALAEELFRIMQDTHYRGKILRGYKKLIQILGTEGASRKAAQLMHYYLTEDRQGGFRAIRQP
jgi:lipid-A-disaccharide synthase